MIQEQVEEEEEVEAISRDVDAVSVRKEISSIPDCI